MLTQIGGELKLIARIGRIFRDDRLKQYGIDSMDSDLILAVFRATEISQDRLCEERMLNKSTMARHLAMLEERGLLCRTVGRVDRRINNCKLTEEGEKLVPMLREVNRQWSEFLLQDFSEEEAAQMQGMLEKLLAAGRDYMKGREKG